MPQSQMKQLYYGNADLDGADEISLSISQSDLARVVIVSFNRRASGTVEFIGVYILTSSLKLRVLFYGPASEITANLQNLNITPAEIQRSFFVPFDKGIGDFTSIDGIGVYVIA